MLTLAQALRTKNMLVAEISNLVSRLEEVTVQAETSKEYSPDDFRALCDKIESKRTILVNLKLAIDAANHKTKNEKCVHGLIIKRGELADTLNMYRSLRSHVKNCLSPRPAYEGSTPYVSQISLKQLDSMTDAIQNSLNDIDSQIATLNATLTVDYELP
jgi:hypothetical protein